MDKYRLHNVAANKGAKGKTYRFKEKDGKLYLRDCTCPLADAMIFDATKATKEKKTSAVDVTK